MIPDARGNVWGYQDTLFIPTEDPPQQLLLIATFFATATLMGTFLFYKCFANNIMSALENSNNNKNAFHVGIKTESRRMFGIHCAIHIGATVWQESVTWALSRLMHTGWWDYKKTKALLPIGSRPRLQGSQLTQPATLQLPTTRTTSVLCSRMTAVSLCFWGYHSCFFPQALHRTEFTWLFNQATTTRAVYELHFLKIKSLLFSKYFFISSFQCLRK